MNHCFTIHLIIIVYWVKEINEVINFKGLNQINDVMKLQHLLVIEKKEIMNTLILICIEQTQISVAKGLYSQVISSLQSILDTFPHPNKADIAFITLNQKIQFYNIPKNLTGEPQIIVVSEIDEANVPLPPEKLFLNIENDTKKIYYMLEKLDKLGETLTQQQDQFYQIEFNQCNQNVDVYCILDVQHPDMEQANYHKNQQILN